MQQFALPPDEIYRRSFAAVDALLPPGNWSPEERHIIRRVVHATGDPQLATMMRFKPDAISAGIAAFRCESAQGTGGSAVACGRGPVGSRTGASPVPTAPDSTLQAPQVCTTPTVFTDVHMVAAGIQKQWLDALGCTLHVLIAQDGLTRLAQESQITRSAAAVLQAAPLLGGKIVAIGNAPTALLALLDVLDEGYYEPPALVLGMPVGFVATQEAKAALWERSYPAIIVEGTRGGSPVAAATINALLELAQRRA